VAVEVDHVEVDHKGGIMVMVVIEVEFLVLIICGGCGQGGGNIFLKMSEAIHVTTDI